MYKKILSILLCCVLMLSLNACRDHTKQDKATPEPEATKAASEEDTITDQELMEQIKDDLTTVTEAELSDVIADMKAYPGQYYGKIYQLEGICKKTEDAIYIVANPDEEGLKLNYVTQDLEDGTKILVIGVPNQGNADSGEEIVFDTVITQSAE